jgi:hypothetical protein
MTDAPITCAVAPRCQNGRFGVQNAGLEATLAAITIQALRVR